MGIRAFATSALFAAALAAIIGIAGSARADTNQMLATTPRPMALAGAYTALSNDAAALYYNPAGLVDADGSYISLAFMLSFPNFSATGSKELADAPRDEGYGIGLAWSPRTILDGNLGIGFSVLLPHRRALRFAVHAFEDPYFVLYENSIEVLETRLGLAYKFFDFISVGASVLLLAGLDGNVTLIAPFQARNDVDPSKPTVVTVDAILPNREFFTAGFQLHASKDLTFGFSYREATFVPIALPIDFDINLLGLEVGTVADLEVKVKYSPPQWSFGGAWQARDDLLLTADLCFAEYAKYQIPYAAVAIIVKGNQDITLLPPRQPKTSLRNVWIPRLGVEWSALEELKIRGGYYYFRSFIRSSDAPVLDGDKHSFSAGVSYGLGRLFLPPGNELELTAAGQLVLFFPNTTAAYEHSGQIFSTTFGAEFRY